MSEPTQEIHVAPDRFEVVDDDVILAAELRSAIALCLYDAVEEAGALLHLRCIVPTRWPVSISEATLDSELLLLDRCVLSMREAAPGARYLQARIVGHLADQPGAAETCDTVVTLARQFLADAGVRLLPTDLASGPARALRFRPAMGWVQVR